MTTERRLLVCFAVLALDATSALADSTVLFDANGGVGAMEPFVITNGVGQTLPPCEFANTNGFFLGWALSANGEAMLLDGDSTAGIEMGQGETITLYAVWREGSGGKGLSVKYYDISSSGYSTWTQSEAAMTNYFALQTPTLEGNTYDWTIGLSSGNVQSSPSSSEIQRMVNAGMTSLEFNAESSRFHGKYSNASQSYFSVLFQGTMRIDTAGSYGFACMADDQIVIYIDGTRVCNTTWANYATGSLYLEKGLHRVGIAYRQNSGGHGFSVQWKKPGDTSYSPLPQSVLFYGTTAYAIRFDANGGEGTMPRRVFAAGDDVTLPASAFARDGYTFAGWATKPDGPITYQDGETIADGLEVASGETITLYARWSMGSYTVRFNANGGTGTMADQTLWVGIPEVLNSNAFSRIGYTFSGWAESAEGEVLYTDNALVTNLATAVGATTSLHAVWIPNEYTVRFHDGEYLPGLKASYYDIPSISDASWYSQVDTYVECIAYYDALTPTLVTNTINVGETLDFGMLSSCCFHGKYAARATENFVLKLEGLLSIDVEGTYSFRLRHDDGCVVYLDGVAIYSSSYKDQNTWYSFATNILEGVHELVIAFHEGEGGGQGLQFQMQDPSDTAMKGLPQSILSYGTQPVVQPFTFDSAQPLSTNTFVRTGYTFAGWAVEQGSAIAYANGAPVLNLATNAGEVVDLYATWATNRYTVCFDANGGSGTMVDAPFVYDTAAALATNTFTRANHFFVGWATETDDAVVYDDCAIVSNLTTAADGVVTLYAVWADGRVLFDANGGEGMMEPFYLFDGAEQTLPPCEFTSTNGFFLGWALSANGEATLLDADSTADIEVGQGETVTLYAVWHEGGSDESLVAWYSFDGDATDSSGNENHGTVNGATLTADRNGNANSAYYFDGNDTIRVACSDSILSVTNAMTIATWMKYDRDWGGWISVLCKGSEPQFSLNFNIGDDAALANGVGAYFGTFPQKGAWTHVAVTLDDYHIAAAYVNGCCVGTRENSHGLQEGKADDLLIGSDPPGSTEYLYGCLDDLGIWNRALSAGEIANLYACGKVGSPYAIRFDVNGGEGAMPKRVYASGEDVTLPSVTFTRDGYTFVGWAMEPDRPIAYVDGETIADGINAANGETITLYARWSLGTYTVHFDANGGTGAMADQTLWLGIPATLAANCFSRMGYAFGGWAASAEGEALYADKAVVTNVTDSVGATTTLHAVWTPNEYAVRFNRGAATGSMANQSFTYDTAQPLATNAFERTGYTFAGWAVEEGGAVIYADGAPVLNLATNAGDVVDFYAVWSTNHYTVCFDANGGSGTMANEPFAYDTEAVLSANTFTRANHFFAGWATKADDAVVYTDGEAVSNLTATADGVVTLYAVWADGRLLFDANGGEGTMKPFYLYRGAGQTLPPCSFSSTNGFFLGWALSVDGEATLLDGDSTGDIAVEPGETITLYAVWHEGSGGNGLLVKYYDISSSGYSTWTQSEAAMTNYFVGLTPSIETNTLAWGATLSTAIPSLDSGDYSVKNRMANIGMTDLDQGTVCRFHGKYATGDYFTAFLTGQLKATLEGESSFAALGDDYVVIYVDGVRVCNSQWSNIAQGSISLTVGWHRISIAFHENSGGQGLIVQWKKPGDTSYSPIPQSVLYYGSPVYAVRFDANGGEGAMPKRVFAVGDDVTLPASAFIHDGYTFVGWATEPDGPIAYEDGETVEEGLEVASGETITLYARWSLGTYTVGFDAGLGTGAMADQTLWLGIPATLAANCFSRMGYAFGGWAASAEGEALYADKAVVTNVADSVGATTTLHAVWTPNEYAVRFNSGVATGSMANQSFTYDTAQPLATNAFERTGYTFAGWAVEEGGAVIYADGATVLNLATNAGDVVDFYATWATNHYTVCFDANGGEGTIADEPFVYDEAAALSTNIFTRTNRFFAGWAMEAGGAAVFADGEVVSNLAAAANGVVTLYAVWADAIVTFDANGGEGAMDSLLLVRGIGQILPPCSFSSTNGFFLGWALSADGEATLLDGDSTEDIAVEAGGTITLYAVWHEGIGGNYMVIDLSAGSEAESYSVSSLPQPPDGGFDTDEYKTTKLVLRRIEPGSFMMSGSYETTLTTPYYIGVFEVTQKQWELVMGSNPSQFSGDTRPVERVSYNMVRGSNTGAQWPLSSAVDSDSYIAKLQSRTALEIDLPTEAQWEYACRAGAATAYYWGNSLDGAYCWYRSNSSSTHPVGEKTPNAWGLYDMHGNTWEWVLDWYGSLVSPQTDPVGAQSGTYRCVKGGSWCDGSSELSLETRLNTSSSHIGYNHGFRLAVPLTVSATYAIHFDANGGEGTMSKRVYASGEDVTLPSLTLTRDGYTFVGWATEPEGPIAYQDGGTVADGLEVASGETITLYARWSLGTYTVSFDAGLGTGAMADQTLWLGIPAALATNCFSRTGYTIGGWAESTDGEALYGDGAVVTNLANAVGATTTLHAVWVPNEYNIRFHDEQQGLLASYYDIVAISDSSWYDSVNTYEKCLAYHAALTPTIVTNTADIGDILDFGDNNSGTAFFHGKYAVYDTENFVLYLEGFMDIAESGLYGFRAKHDDGCVIYIDGASVYSSYNARDWSSFSIELSTGVHEIVIAHHEGGGGQRLQLQMQGPSDTAMTGLPQSILSYGTPPVVQPFTYDAAQPLSTNTFTRTGYTLAGWATEKDGSIAYADGATVLNLATNAGEVVDLYATWATNHYTVCFETNGGSGTMAVQSFVYDEAAALSTNTLTWTNRFFAGWATEAGGAAVFADGEVVSNLTATADGVVTLYAVWADGRVLFDANGGEGTMAPFYLYNGAEQMLPPCSFSSTNGFFLGWALSADGEATLLDGDSTEDIAVESGGTITLYAVWHEGVSDESLVAWYSFDGDATDSSGNGNHGTVNGATLTADRNGNANSAYYFDGNDTIRVACSDSILSVTNAMTIATWIKYDRTYNTGEDWIPVICKGAGYRQFSLNLNTSGGAELGDEVGASFETLPQQNVWTHVAVSLDEKHFATAFVNGIPVGTLQNNCSLSAGYNESMVIGSDPCGATEYLYGCLDNLGIWNRALSVGEIADLYSRGKLGSAYAIRFDANGGEGAMPKHVYASGEDVTLPSATFTLNGYSCVGWATAPDGPIAYQDGETVEGGIEVANGETITLYAVWPLAAFYTLEEALDATNLVWRTGGDGIWLAMKTEEVPTGGFGRSGTIGNGESSWVETTVKGAGTITFKWRTSCQRRLDMALFSVDGENKERLFGETGWTEVAVDVAGVTNHVLRWTFTRGATGSAGENCAWLDEVVWTPDAAANAQTLTVASRYDVCEPSVGSHSYAWGDEFSASAGPFYSNGLERATCTGWTGTGSVPATGAGTNVTFTIEENSTLTWSWATEYRLALSVEGEGTLSRESDWFAEGAMEVITATPGLYQRFVRWEGDTDGCRLTGAILRAPMTRGRSIRAVFEQATCTLSVADALGAAWPTNGLHTFDMGTEISAWSTNVVAGDRTRYLCTGWTGTGSVPASGVGTNAVFTLLEDSSIAWTWQTHYLVRVTVVGDGTADIGEAWIAAGSNLVVTATPGGTAYTAAVWSGDIERAVPDGLRLTIPVDGPKDISIAFNALSVGRALEQESRDWTTGQDGTPWTPVTSGTHDGVDACMSGAIVGGYGESVLSATFSGPGDLSFWWRLGASTSTCGIDLYVDGQDVNVWLIDAECWVNETVPLGAGDHVVEWIFWGDGLDPLAAAWLDEVEFAGDQEPLTETQTTPVHVPYVWLDAFNLGDATEAGYEAAAKALAANRLNTVWECYVAGLDPTNAASVLRATIRFENGEPVIGYEPARPAHTPANWYKVDGKQTLGDVWAPKAEGHRFFRVRIEIPEE